MRAVLLTANERGRALSFSKVLLIFLITCSKNGDVFEGMWKNHKKDGVGIYKYKATGKEEILVYEDGKLVK